MENLVSIISGVLAAEKVKKADDLAKKIAEALRNKMPKSSGHKPYVENGTTYIWCSRHQAYHPSDYMVPNSSKESGYANYCKPAQAKWEWMHKTAQKLTSIAAFAFGAEDIEKGKKLVDKATFLAKEKNNQPECYKDVMFNDDPKKVIAEYMEIVYMDITDILTDNDRKVLGLKK